MAGKLVTTFKKAIFVYYPDTVLERERKKGRKNIRAGQ
jgi:hypothetical protein